MSREVVAYFLSSVDGVVESPNEFVFDRFDDEMLDHLGAVIAEQDAVLLGRRTYQMWAPHWPGSTQEPFASFINNVPKYVASTTMRSVEWDNSTLIDGDVSDVVRRLKAEPGHEIGIHGSPTLFRHLLRDGLVDEVKLAVFPAIAGAGARLFPGEGARMPLELLRCAETGGGVLFATYRPTLSG